MSQTTQVQTLPMTGSTTVLTEMPITKADIVDIFEARYVEQIEAEVATAQAKVDGCIEFEARAVDQAKSIILKRLGSKIKAMTKAFDQCYGQNTTTLVKTTVSIVYGDLGTCRLHGYINMDTTRLVRHQNTRVSGMIIDLNAYHEEVMTEVNASADIRGLALNRKQLTAANNELFQAKNLLMSTNISQVVKAFKVKMTVDALKNTREGECLLNAMRAMRIVSRLK